MINLTKNYNNKICKDSLCIDYTQSANTKVFFEPNVGLGLATMSHESSSDKIRSMSISFGANFRFFPPIYSKQWSIITGVSVSQYSFDKIIFDNFYGTSRYHLIKLQYALLSIPLNVEYTFKSGKYKPFLSLGGEISLRAIQTMSLKNIYRKYDGTFEDIGSQRSEYHDYPYTLQAGIGVRRFLDDNSYWQVKLQAGRRMQTLSFGDYFDYTYVDLLSVNFAYGFKLKEK